MKITLIVMYMLGTGGTQYVSKTFDDAPDPVYACSIAAQEIALMYKGDAHVQVWCKSK